MAQAILLSNISDDITGNPVRLFSPDTVTIQFTPRRDEFTAHVLIEIATTANLTPGYLWYSIPTIGIDPWFPAVNLEFSRHGDAVAFTLRLAPGVFWMRASVTEYSRGTISAYIAH